MQSYRDRGLVDLPASTAVPSGSKVPAPIRYSKKRRTWSSSDETNNSGSEDTQDEDSSMDDMDFTTRRHGQRPMGPNNVEQEYQKWVTGDLTDADINLLAYWEVRTQNYIYGMLHDVLTFDIGQSQRIPDNLSCCHGFPTYSSIICTF